MKVLITHISETTEWSEPKIFDWKCELPPHAGMNLSKELCKHIEGTDPKLNYYIAFVVMDFFEGNIIPVVELRGN